MRRVLGVDSSTSGCKAIVWGESGEVVAEGRASVGLETPGPGAFEQDGEALWAALVEAVRGAVAGLAGAGVEAVCVTHQRETFVVCDEAGRPLAPAVTWMDGRGADEVTRAAADLGVEFLHTVTGKVPCLTPSFYKLLALWGRRPELREGRPRVADVHAFLARRLVGEWVTSLASADPTGLVDLGRRAYSEPIVARAGLSLAQLPRLVEPGEVIGGLTREAASVLGLPAGLPVVAGAGDGQAAGLGAGVSGASAYLNLGTAIVCGRRSDEAVIHRNFRTLIGAAPGSYFLEGDLKSGTFLVGWLTGRLMGASGAAQGDLLARIEREAASLGPGAGGVLLPYWAGVMNPYWDDLASGAIVGLRGEHGPGHVFRALLEGLACESRLHVEGLEAAGPIDELVVMGGGAQSDLFCQIVADVTGRRVVRCATNEASCLGAGVLAAVAAGVFADCDEATRAMTHRGEVFTPGAARERHDALYREVYLPLYPALAPAMAALARLGGA